MKTGEPSLKTQRKEICVSMMKIYFFPSRFRWNPISCRYIPHIVARALLSLETVSDDDDNEEADWVSKFRRRNDEDCYANFLTFIMYKLKTLKSTLPVSSTHPRLKTYDKSSQLIFFSMKLEFLFFPIQSLLPALSWRCQGKFMQIRKIFYSSKDERGRMKKLEKIP